MKGQSKEHHAVLGLLGSFVEAVERRLKNQKRITRFGETKARFRKRVLGLR